MALVGSYWPNIHNDYNNNAIFAVVIDIYIPWFFHLWPASAIYAEGVVKV